MSSVKYNGNTYEVDEMGFLLDHHQWDEAFAEGAAAFTGIPEGLSKRHWKVIHFIRDTFDEQGRCPLVYETCRANGIDMKTLGALFPSGYLRGACKLAGITYRESYVKYSWSLPARELDSFPSPDKTYEVDVRGFLKDADQWDEMYAVHKAYEMKMPKILEEEHWRIIHYLREGYWENQKIPTVFETCRDNGIELADLERLFPDGYHRGAVKIAGLRVR
jgi:tRNA 2-thiouridine synthesizing protein E